MTGWNTDAWNAATQGNYATYNESGILEVLFTSNDFRLAEQPDKFGRTPFEFDVIQNNKAVVYTIGSVRLMNALKAILPLENKRVRIIRTGTGTATTFTVEILEEGSENESHELDIGV